MIAMPYPEMQEGQKTLNTDEESDGIFEDVDGDLSPEEGADPNLLEYENEEITED